MESIRIQLEGQLELLEAAVDRWRLAADALASEDWQSDARWLAVAERDDALESAMIALEGKSPDSPLLQSLRETRKRAEAFAIAHMKTLRIEVPPSTASAGSVLNKLKRERPQPALEWSAPPPLSLVVLLSVAVFALFLWASLAFAHEGVEWLAALFNLIAVGASGVIGWFFAKFVRPRYRLQFTENDTRIFLADQVVGSFESGRLARLRIRRRSRGWVLQFVDLYEPRTFEVESEIEPTRVMAALRARGVPVDDL